jgi:peptidoglycan/xylan/chitin deacetylase (PgdA/CDA1 family)
MKVPLSLRRISAAAAVLVGTGCGFTPPVGAGVQPEKAAWTGVVDFAVPVLMYHRVCPLSEQEAKSPLTRDLTVLPEDFEQQVKHLVDNGFVLLSVYDVQSALLSDGKLPEKAVALTFDDGYRDNFEHAYPILKKYRASATIFLVKNTVDDPRHLTWEMIRGMRKQQVRYGSHTVSHADLVAVDQNQLDDELCESKRFLESGLGEPVTSLAYPAGRFDDRVVERVRVAGYLTAWDKGGGPVTPGDDPFRLPRVRVHGRTSMEDFERKVWSGFWMRKMSSG